MQRRAACGPQLQVGWVAVPVGLSGLLAVSGLRVFGGQVGRVSGALCTDDSSSTRWLAAESGSLHCLTAPLAGAVRLSLCSCIGAPVLACQQQRCAAVAGVLQARVRMGWLAVRMHAQCVWVWNAAGFVCVQGGCGAWGQGCFRSRSEYTMCVACMEGCLPLAAWLPHMQPWQQLCVLVLKSVVLCYGSSDQHACAGFCFRKGALSSEKAGQLENVGCLVLLLPQGFCADNHSPECGGGH